MKKLNMPNNVKKILHLMRKSGYLLFIIRLPSRVAKVTLNKLNTAYWKLFLGKIGDNVLIEVGVHFENPKNIFIGDNVYIGKGSFFVSENYTSTAQIDSFVHIGKNCHIDHTGGLKIGENTLLSEGVSIFTHSHGYDPRSKPVAKPLTISKNCWIGYRVTILETTTEITDSVIVGACSLVTKRCDKQKAIIAGTPSKFIKYAE